MAQLSKDAAKLRDQFRKLADILDKHYANVNTAKLVGSAVYAYGSAVRVAGDILVPFTAGSSIFLSGAGEGISLLGASTRDGAEYVGQCIEANELQGIEKSWNEFREKVAQVVDLMHMPDKEMERQAKILFGGGELYAKTLKRLKSLRDATAPGARTRSLLDRIGQTAVTRLAKRLSSVVGFGLSVKEFIDTAVDIHQGNKSKAAQALRKQAEILDEIAQMGI